MRDETVTISTLDKAIAGALEEYNADVQSKLRTLVDNAMRKLVKLTKATAPRDTGEYVKHIASKTTPRQTTPKRGMYAGTAPTSRICLTLAMPRSTAGASRGRTFWILPKNRSSRSTSTP